MAALSLRCDMTNIAAVFQTISMCASPPFALIVVDAARIKTQIAADRSDNAMARRSNCFGCLRKRPIATGDLSVPSKRSECHARANRHVAAIGRNLGQSGEA